MKRPFLILLLGSLLSVAAIHLVSCRQREALGCDFETEAILDELGWQCGALYRLVPEHATSGTKSLEISFYPAPDEETDHYPGVTFSGFDPDWSGRAALGFDVYNPGSSEIRLGVRVDDRAAPDFGDRFNRTVILAPGAVRTRISLSELRTSGTKRALDTGRILRLTLFLANPGEPGKLYLDNVRLE